MNGLYTINNYFENDLDLIIFQVFFFSLERDRNLHFSLLLTSVSRTFWLIAQYQDQKIFAPHLKRLFYLAADFMDFYSPFCMQLSNFKNFAAQIQL